MPLLLTNWEIFWDFGKVIWEIPSTFQKVPLLTLNKGCHLAGCFSKFPAKIFLPSLTLNKEAIFEGVFQKKLEKFFGPLGKQKSRPSENGKAALRLNDLLVHIYIVYCGQAYGRRARAMTNGSNRSKEIISRLGLSSRTFCFITNYGQFRRKRG